MNQRMALSDSRFAKNLAAKSDFAPFNLVVDATGALTIGGHGPEKSLAALQADQLLAQLQTNTVGPALMLQQIAPLMAKGDAWYAKLSARVGSISDNSKGGWYSYRASKAAMNMVLQTAALELQRKNPLLRLVALQPRTVKSKLSQPFAAFAHEMLNPQDSATGMLRAMWALPPKSGAYFIDYKGEKIDW